MKLIIGFLTYIGILFAIVGGAALFSNLVAYFVKEENKSGVRLILFILWIFVSCIYFFSGTSPFPGDYFRPY